MAAAPRCGSCVNHQWPSPSSTAISAPAPVDVHLRRVSADNVATLRRTIERRRHHAINRVPPLAVLLRSEPDSAHPVIRGPVAGLLGGRYADAVDRRHPLRRANVVVVERSQPQRCRVGRTDIRFDDRATQAANDFKTRSATGEFEVAMYWTGENAANTVVAHFRRR